MAFVGSFFPPPAGPTGGGAATALAGRLATISGPLPATLGNLASGTQLTGIILAAQSNGKQQIRTQQGVLTLTPRTPLPEGGRVLLELSGMPARSQARLVSLTPPTPVGPPPGEAAAAQSPQQAATAQMAALGQRWTGLEKLLNEAAGKNAGQAALAAALPRPGAGLARSLMIFIAAMRAGGLEPLMGRALALNLLAHPRLGPLAGAVRQDMARLERFAFEPGPGAWQGLFAPLIVGNQMLQMRLFLRRDGAPEDEAGGPKAKRFIVETELGALGPIQIDGLLGARHLDLVLRSVTPLPAPWQPKLAALVSEASALAGLVGKIGFQTCGRFPVAPLEEALPGAPARALTA